MIVLSMIFMHIVDDYYLQGVLASMKQKQWWQEHSPAKLNENDYVMALFMHAFSWTFMIMLPIALSWHFILRPPFVSLMLFNVGVHMAVDDLKANKKSINLITDQLIHLVQIFFTAYMLLS